MRVRAWALLRRRRAGLVVAVATLMLFTAVARAATGELYAFGANGSGQLGSAMNNGTGNPNPTPALVSLPGATGPVTAIAAGSATALR